MGTGCNGLILPYAKHVFLAVCEIFIQVNLPVALRRTFRRG